MVGKDSGLFAKNGLTSSPVQIRGGAVSTMAIMERPNGAFRRRRRLGDRRPCRGAANRAARLPTDLEPVYLHRAPEIKSPCRSQGKSGWNHAPQLVHPFLSPLRCGGMIGVGFRQRVDSTPVGGSRRLSPAWRAKNRCGRIDHTGCPTVLNLQAQLAGARRVEPKRSGRILIVPCDQQSPAFVQRPSPKNGQRLLERLRKRDFKADQERSKTRRTDLRLNG